MTLRPPLVINAGNVQQLQSGDGITVGSATVGSVALATATGTAGQFRQTNGAGTESWGWAYPFRNRIINGKMEIDQRRGGSSKPLVPLAALSGTASNYGLDRWATWISSGGSSIAFAQRTSVGSGFFNAYQLGRVSGQTSTPVINLAQVIETANCYDLQGQQVTLSFYARCDANFSAASSNLSFAIATGTSNDEGLTSMAAGTWAGYAITATQTATLTSTVTRYSYTFTLGGSVSEIGVNFFYTPVGTAGAHDGYEITGVQLEQGLYATPFEHRPVMVEIHLCQRYFEKSYDLDVMPGTNTFTGARTMGTISTATTTNVRYADTFKVTKRVSPTPYWISTDGTGNTIGTAGGDLTPGAWWVGTNCYAVEIGISSTDARISFHYQADAEL